jgi:protein subunit release factor B
MEKQQALRERLERLGIALTEVDEQATKGTGPGGQKVNKTSSGVLLRYVLRGEQITVKWTSERRHALNRFLALRELADQVEMRVSPQTSERLAERARIRKQKDRARRRGRDRGPTA